MSRLISVFHREKAMTKRVSLDDPVWSESTVGESTATALKSWKEDAPSIEEYQNLVEDNSCSDLVYRSFYFALPYFVDELEKRPLAEQFKMVDMLDWKLIRVFEGNPDKECRDQVKSQAHRIVKLLVRMILAGCSSDLTQDNLAAIAGVQGHSALAEAINKLDLR